MFPDPSSEADPIVAPSRLYHSPSLTFIKVPEAPFDSVYHMFG